MPRIDHAAKEKRGGLSPGAGERWQGEEEGDQQAIGRAGDERQDMQPETGADRQHIARQCDDGRRQERADDQAASNA